MSFLFLFFFWAQIEKLHIMCHDRCTILYTCGRSSLSMWWVLKPVVLHLRAPMIGENQPLVIDEPVEFEKWPVKVQDFMKTTHRFRGICKIYLKLIKKNRDITTCNRLDLETLGSWPVVCKNLLQTLEGSLFQQNIFSPWIWSHVMLTFVTAHLYTIRIPHPSTCEVEIGSSLQNLIGDIYY